MPVRAGSLATACGATPPSWLALSQRLRQLDERPLCALLDAGGRRAAITDFCLSTLKLAGSLSSGTSKGAGTDAFKAPELLQEDANGNPVHGVSCAADVYAFAITAWCVLADCVTQQQ